MPIKRFRTEEQKAADRASHKKNRQTPAGKIAAKRSHQLESARRYAHRLLADRYPDQFRILFEMVKKERGLTRPEQE